MRFKTVDFGKLLKYTLLEGHHWWEQMELKGTMKIVHLVTDMEQSKSRAFLYAAVRNLGRQSE